jgi:uncharacterized protein YgiM (DUF1202 family)
MTNILIAPKSIAHAASFRKVVSCATAVAKAETALQGAKFAIIDAFRLWIAEQPKGAPSAADEKFLRSRAGDAYYKAVQARKGKCTLESAQRIIRSYYQAAANNAPGDYVTDKDKQRDKAVAKAKVEKAATKAASPGTASPGTATIKDQGEAIRREAETRASHLSNVRAAMAETSKLAAWATNPKTLTANQVSATFTSLQKRLALLERAF